MCGFRPILNVEKTQLSGRVSFLPPQYLVWGAMWWKGYILPDTLSSACTCHESLRQSLSACALPVLSRIPVSTSGKVGKLNKPTDPSRHSQSLSIAAASASRVYIPCATGDPGSDRAQLHTSHQPVFSIHTETYILFVGSDSRGLTPPIS